MKARLTPEVEALILAGIRAGGYPHVAAEAAGIPEPLFNQWMHMGSRGGRGTARYKNLILAIRQAQAQARLKAEIDARQADPKFWLRSGPGKETPTSPGWSMPTKPILVQDNRTVNLLASPEWNSLWAMILHTLAQYPDARAALAHALQEQAIALPAPKP
jgi:hypothetical protein